MEEILYILIMGSKGRYDRDIAMTKLAVNEDLEIISADLLTRAIDDLKDRCEKDCVDKAIGQVMNEETYIKIDEYSSVSAKYDKYGNIFYYSTGCPSDNEYMGFTYQILEV
jgi:hypothetical protein